MHSEDISQQLGQFRSTVGSVSFVAKGFSEDHFFDVVR